MRFAWVVATFVAAFVGCYAEPSEKSASSGGPGAPGANVGPFTLRGKLIDKDTKAPLTKSLVVIEVGGRYLPNPDPSKGHPDYRFVAATNADGTFEVRDVPAGITSDGKFSPTWGLHTFENGYRYGTDQIMLEADGAPRRLEVTVSPQLAEDVKPTATEFKVEPATVAPGGKVVFTARVEAAGNLLADAGRDGDPLSEEVLLAEVTTQWARAMAPPSRGIQGFAYPNGTWRYEGNAPTKPGKYTFHLVTSSERCITSDRVSVELVVDGGLTDAGSTPGVGPGPSPGAVPCNSVPSLDKLLVLEQVATPAPAPQGGVVNDGTYVLSAYRRYTGPSGAKGPKADTSFHETAIYSGNILQVNYGDSTFNVHETYRHEVSGTAFTHTRTCPSTPAVVFPGTYTANGPSLSYYEDRGMGITDEFAFTRVK